VNKRANPTSNGGETIKTTATIRLESEHLGVDPSEIRLPRFSPDELVNKKFLRQVGDETMRAEVMRKIIVTDNNNAETIQLLCDVGGDGREEMIAYNELSDLIERQEEAKAAGEPSMYTYKDIKDHKGPLHHRHKDWNGSSYNVLVEWDDGSETWEPLSQVAKDDPISTARYARENNLLNTPGWKRLNRIAQQEKLFKRMVLQAKIRPGRTIRYQFGVQVPRDAREALKLDQQNEDSRWKAAMAKEFSMLNEFEVFKDCGIGGIAPPGYKRINVHFVFAVKEDSRRKGRLVANGNMTEVPNESVYSGVVSIRSLRIITLLAELNGLKLISADIGSAYLTAKTSEKVYCIGGTGFGELEGHTLLIDKALYGLRTSGARFHEKFADTLKQMGFVPCLADPDVWMRDAGDVWEYVGMYVDDAYAALKDPDAFMSALRGEPHNYTVTGGKHPIYHLGGDIYRDPDETLCWGAKTYIKRMIDSYVLMFNEKPRDSNYPILPNDHPELDDTMFLDQDGIAKYQSLIGALQWCITLCRFDIATAVMSMGRYRCQPREGHLVRVQRIVGYLKKYPHAAIRFRTHRPAHTDYKIPTYDWLQSVYGKSNEEIPDNMPTPKGAEVRTTTYKDANLCHDLTTGRAVTGILHFLNGTPIDWTSKRQNTVETATYGSEFSAARTATEQIMDIRYTLRMMGVPLDGAAYLFGDNEGVIKSSTLPHSTLKKRHNALSYHRVREAVASGIIYFLHIPGKQNVADILTKFLERSVSYPFMNAVLLWRGNTMKIDDGEEKNIPRIKNDGE
jgi:hypothetical protein